MNAIFSNCIEKPEKFRTSTGFEPMPSRCRCGAVTHWPMKPLMLGVGQLSMSHNQWIALKAHSDWLLKLRISFAIHLRTTCTGFAPKTVVIVAGIKELKITFLCNYSPQCRVASDAHLPSCKVVLSDSTCAVIGWFSGPYSTVWPAKFEIFDKTFFSEFFMSFMLRKLVKLFQSWKQLFKKTEKIYSFFGFWRVILVAELTLPLD